MLEGLEVTEVKLHKLENNFTIGSEFYSKFYVHLMDIIGKCHYPSKRLDAVCPLITDGDHSAPNYKDNGVLFLLSESVQNGYIDDSIYRYISPETHAFLSKSALKEGDVLVTKTGIYFGKSAVVPVGFPEANTSAHVGVLRIGDSSINPYFLSTYINCKYGYHQFRRRGIKATRPEIKLVEFNDIQIVQAPSDIQQQVAEKILIANQKRIASQQLYTSAETYLLECLGMADFAANPDAYNIKTLKESFLETGRFDSEYYLPKYEDYIELVHSYPNGYDLIGNVCDIKDNNFTPFSGVQYKYIELANIGKSGEITGCDIQDGENLPTRARRLVHQGDVIVSSIEGSLDSCALVMDEYDGALCSTGFYVLQSHQHNPETLLTLFKSLPIQNLMKKGCSGTILTAIGKSEFEKIPIPLIRKEVQEEIAKHVQKSFELRKEAMQLLENAKLTVEAVIENGGGNLLIYNKLQADALKEWNKAVWSLFTEIGITSYIDAKAPIVSAYKKLSNSFLKSGRLDAEYYQPKYDHLFSELKRFKTKTIKQIATPSKSIEPGSEAYREKGIPFIRVADLSKFGLSEPAVYLDELEFKDTIRPQKDTILLSKDGSVGIAYKVDEPVDVITSGAIVHLNITDKEVLPDYLTLVLNSAIVKLQAERDAGGSIIQHWKPSEIEEVIIPILPMANQIKISEMLQQSFSLRKESKRLLQEAIQIVETAIKEN